MKILPQLIGILNKEETRNYKLYTTRTNDKADRKDVLLFDYIRANGLDYNEDKIHKKLYGEADKNSLYRLRNRLLEDVGVSLLIQYYNSSDINIILNNILLFKLLLSKNQSAIGLYYLNKAEKKSLEIESFELLDIIYNEYIKLSQENTDINPEEYIAKRKENRTKLTRLQEIDDILAVVTYKVKISQNFSSSNSEINELLNKTIGDYSKDESVANSVQLRFRMYHALSRILLQQHDFISLEKYLLKTFNEFTEEKLFNKSNHETKLQMLTYIANSLFKNEKNEASLKYLDLLKEAMNEFNGLLHDKYLFYYYNILVLNYGKTNIPKAIEILEEAKENQIIKKQSVYMGFVYLNLAVYNFGLNDYKSSLKSLVKLKLLDTFSGLDEAFRFKISVAELILRYELEDTDFISEFIKQIRKEFKVILADTNYTKDAELIILIESFVKSDNVRTDTRIQNLIDKYLSTHKSTATTDSEIFNYNDWLQKHKSNKAK